MDISKNVMEKIKRNEIKIKPKVYFFFGNMLLGAGITLSLIISIISINFMFHALEQRPLFRLMGLGRMGVVQSFIEMPWLFILAALGFTYIGIYLLNKTDIIYRRNPIPYILAVPTLVLLLGFAAYKSGFNQNLQKHRKIRQFMKQLPTETWVQGTVSEVYHENITIKTDSGMFLTLKTDNNTVKPGRFLRPGDCIRAIGRFAGETFEASGIFGCPKQFIDLNERNF
ncbi:MAG: hypothetical protein KatS3mg101_0681 [Patescibacteria group bacterium]|nr:MAG: hypothetical protein KatS3mg101_0681 [Patescibacteria group bacterium]